MEAGPQAEAGGSKDDREIEIGGEAKKDVLEQEERKKRRERRTPRAGRRLGACGLPKR